jgi:hypothetical protein
MASFSSTMATSIVLGTPPSDKLTRENFLLWKMRVLTDVHGALGIRLLDNFDAAPCETLEVEDNDKKIMPVPNPVYGVCVACLPELRSTSSELVYQNSVFQHPVS